MLSCLGTENDKVIPVVISACPFSTKGGKGQGEQGVRERGGAECSAVLHTLYIEHAQLLILLVLAPLLICTKRGSPLRCAAAVTAPPFSRRQQQLLQPAGVVTNQGVHPIVKANQGGG